MLINGEYVEKDEKLTIRNPYNNEAVGHVSSASKEDVIETIELAKRFKSPLTAYDCYEILFKTAEEVKSRSDELSRLITKEIGISLKDSRHELERAYHVIQLSAEEAKRVGGEICPSEVTPLSGL